MSEAESAENTGKAASLSPALGCLLTLFAAVLASFLLLVVLSIALRGEARFSKGDLGAVRIWLIRESANQGLGLSTTRVVAGDESSGEACIRTIARFFTLRSAQPVEDVSYCECYERQGGNWTAGGDCLVP